MNDIAFEDIIEVDRRRRLDPMITEALFEWDHNMGNGTCRPFNVFLQNYVYDRWMDYVLRN